MDYLQYKEFLQHSKGAWNNHKYSAKVKTKNGKIRYIYTGISGADQQSDDDDDEELDAKTSLKAKAKDKAFDYAKDHVDIHMEEPPVKTTKHPTFAMTPEWEAQQIAYEKEQERKKKEREQKITEGSDIVRKILRIIR